jgi:hypothetical protein
LKTKKKLIEDYKSTISSLSLENKLLETKIKDLETTLDINQNILYKYLLNLSNDQENQKETKDLINTTKQLWKDNLDLLKRTNTAQINVALLQEISEDTPYKIKEELRYFKINNEKIKENINKQKAEIIKKQKKLIDIRKNNFHLDAKTENYITVPNKKNVEANQEILKINLIHNKLKPICEKKEEKVKKIKEELNDLMNKVNTLKDYIYSTENDVNEDDIIDKKELNDFIKTKIKEYNFTADEIESGDELDEEKNENLDEWDDVLSSNEVKKLKAQLDQLMKDYNILKNQCNEYEEIISKNKKQYKNVEGKINELKESFKI